MASFNPLTARNLIETQRQLISKLEQDTQSSVCNYERIISSQNNIISKMEKRYNEMLHSLIESFDDMENNAYMNNVDDIQSDLNNLIQKLNEIKENEAIEKPLCTISSYESSPVSLSSISKNLRISLTNRISANKNNSMEIVPSSLETSNYQNMDTNVNDLGRSFIHFNKNLNDLNSFDLQPNYDDSFASLKHEIIYSNTNKNMSEGN